MFNTTGSIVAIITPMTNSLEVDYSALEQLVEWHIREGTQAIVSVGTTGESATLDEHEHLEVIQQTIAFANGRIPVIAGTGANSTLEAVSLTTKAKELGADAVLLVTPYYNKPTQEGLYLHFKTIAEAVDIPQILYNVPGRTAVDMLPATIKRLSTLTNIVGIKDATGDLAVAKELMDILPETFLKYSGDDKTALEFIAMGGHGGISVTANVCPKQVSEVYDLAQSEYERAHEIDSTIASLHDDLFIESNPIPVKFSLYKMQKCTLGIRLPLTILHEAHHERITQSLQRIGVL